MYQRGVPVLATGSQQPGAWQAPRRPHDSDRPVPARGVRAFRVGPDREGRGRTEDGPTQAAWRPPSAAEWVTAARRMAGPAAAARLGSAGTARKAHAAFSSGCVPYLMRMIHGATDSPIANHGALQRLLVGGLGPAPAMGRPARRFHTQGTCGFLIGLRVPNANDPGCSLHVGAPGGSPHG